MVETIIHHNQILAIIIFKDFSMGEGVHFFTPDEFSQQLGYIHHPAGKIIQPHLHKIQMRQISYTQEVLVIKRGKIRVDFFDDNRQFIKSRTLTSGDLILLASGGHGFETLEEVEMIEIKQGPYSGECDKERFDCSETMGDLQ
ncbi:MAG TPA: hypothetical protein PL158_13940 [Bacillota bacterium]|jgi:hypothetical protein|nr:hypothetical protein [Bacillota bacterium]HOL11209.1 hypothetical protein [Bacillota bacterium]